MGKKQHQSDKLYLTNKEWKHEWGGRKEAALQQLSRLPFSCCALSLTPFTDPVMSPDGTIFEVFASSYLCSLLDINSFIHMFVAQLLNIIPYIKEHGVNPVTGQPLSIKQLTKLVFHKNPSGDYHCPVTFKVFNDHSHIVAIRTSGNVYSYEAVDQLNVKAKNMTDLLSGEAFSKADIVTVQDPADWSRRQIDLFEHIRRKRAQIDGGDADVATSTAQSSTAAAAAAPAENQAEAFTGKRLPKPAAEDERDPKRTKAAPIQLAPARAHFTTGAAAASFTSTAQVLVTTNQSRALDEEEIREKRYTNIRRAALTRKGQADQTSMKAFVRLNTNLGALNLRLDCDFAPRTCHNFLALCEKGYYNGVKFHRLISNFMIQVR
jgi:peptidyl-prolyl cis-trans isomerase-like protein 2